VPLEPRFRRVAALNRTFVDRETVVAAVTEAMQRVGDGPRVVNLVGVGGIGKSRLLRELRQHHCGDARTTQLDLQIPSMRRQEDALAAMRAELAGQGVGFDRFDIAYAVLWQRLHPHLRIARRELPFVDESEVLGELIDGAAGVPVVGTAVGLARLLDRASTARHRKQRIRTDATLHQLDELNTADLVDAVTYLFAQDLREASKERPYVVFVDAYEALVPSPLRSGRIGSDDVWLRDLLLQLDRGMVAVASREPLAWQAYDPEWAEVIQVIEVGELPVDARHQILTEYGLDDPAEVEAVAAASAGVPFYLHLAVDAGRTTQVRARTSVVSTEEILQRFLHNVSPQEIRALELLSVARVFDFEVFHAVGRAFSVGNDRVTWESLTAYSFIFPAVGSGVRMHQLMRSALHQRLSPESTVEIAALLAGVWQERADVAVRRDPPAVTAAAAALQEVVYSRLQAGTIDGAQVLALADEAFALGGRQYVDGILNDLRNHLDSTGAGSARVGTARGDDLSEAAACLAAETAVLLGQGHRAAELAAASSGEVDTVVGARLATAVANGHRIDGDTAIAQGIFRDVWRGRSGATRNPAGLWVADLEMCQGQFPQAVSLAEDVLADCPPDDHITRADAQRLLHLAYRFSMDFTRSWDRLRAAQDLYARAGSAVGGANLLTNATELLAWTDPAAALVTGEEAVAAQSELGAQHEIGKAHTAIGVAQLQLGDLAGATVSFDAAVEALDRARYRSGRARAELFRAALHAQAGRVDRAVDSVRWSVSEMGAAEVYPTLIVAAAQLLDHLSRPSRDVAEAAARARAEIRPLGPLGDLENRLDVLVRAVLGEAVVEGSS
jgi:tetratricopeptide (TPR) repeat protein